MRTLMVFLPEDCPAACAPGDRLSIVVFNGGTILAWNLNALNEKS
jgi:hypothetical protein